MVKKSATKLKSDFDKLARLIKNESEEIHGEVRGIRAEIVHLEKKVDAGFEHALKELAVINRRLDTIIQMQLDEHARRIKKLETAVFS